jgi:hypothetical protein
MAEDRWISVADAARFLGTTYACRLIKWAWRQGVIQLFGIRPGENEPVAIPAKEGRIDFAASRIVTGPFVWFQTQPAEIYVWLPKLQIERHGKDERF